MKKQISIIALLGVLLFSEGIVSANKMKDPKHYLLMYELIPNSDMDLDHSSHIDIFDLIRYKRQVIYPELITTTTTPCQITVQPVITTEPPIIVTEPSEMIDPNTAPYILNTKTKKFHRPDCRDVSKISSENLGGAPSREWAIDNGYSPCGHCDP